MRSLLRAHFLGLICLLLIASSDAAVNVYGNRSGRPPITPQSVGVVSVNPGGNQTPDPVLGGEAVSSQSNTGHGSTQSSANRVLRNGAASQTRTCLWHSFSAVPGTKTRVTLKFDWTLNASALVSVEGPGSGGTALYNFRIEYSLDNGSNWTVGRVVNGSVSIDTSGSESIDLPNPGAIDITQIRLRDRIFASATVSGLGHAEASSNATASVSNISLEVEAVNCIVSVPANRWKGEYFSNQTLSGSPTMVGDDSAVGTDFLNLNFGSGSPHSICAPFVDNFSARWTRTVNLAQGIYRFSAAVDNGARLYVDGYLRIDQWANSPLNTYTADVFLDAGDHAIKLEFIEYTGGASVSLSWTTVSGANCRASVPAGQWKGEYYSNTNLSGSSAMVRADGAGFPNFNFGSSGPGSGCGLGVDYFSARWTRTVNFAEGIHRFSVTGDDGVRLYVDGQLKIDKWFLQGATTYTADVKLSAGSHAVKLEYFENDGASVALLSWKLVTSLSCLPDVPLIGAAPRTAAGEIVATTAIPVAPKRCGQKSSD
jgi:hypothetical protein